ncbi:MAG: hypothetical protein A2286_13140 [Gammaproteobacteria bacterium RIFOXYA12_FULL_61_12]|nr:MAG: hypothetical protein A2514_01420 [Gammaproteobacteria bacterium RIFOXYD12_FULL_61_37]OGT93360.1 MAG: hypothetical protein A2286_13140 [Gammaproteobacteria bacterium RIFOXYA12_FULL_61_12]
MAFDLAKVQVDFVHATGGVMPFSVEERQQDSRMLGGVGRAGGKPAFARLGIAQLFDNCLCQNFINLIVSR